MIKPALTSLRRNSAKLLLASCLLSLMLPIGVYADDDDDSGPWHVIVDNWQTHKPRVTALRSLNAYLATDKGQAVYYVPTLEELPNIKNAVADTTDYRGNNQKFAAVYDGYFDQMCYEALVRKSDGTYSKTPAIVQSEGRDKVRELTTLGYDFLLTDETITDISPSGEDVNAGYIAHKLDLANGRVDLNTALMDIYKAVGQEKYDNTYIFTPDSGLTVTSSPIQGELSLNLSQYDSVDNSAGKAWVFVTRTNPSLYWKQAVYDGIVLDAEAFTGNPNADNSSAKSTIVTLADFCNYAYNIMNIYGEPVMTAGGTAYKTSSGKQVSEAQYVLDVANAARDKLLEKGYAVIMARESLVNNFENSARSVWANNSADIHVAIHIDAKTYGPGWYRPSAKMATHPNYSKHAAQSEKLGTSIENALETTLGMEKFTNRNGVLTGYSYSTIPTAYIELYGVQSKEMADFADTHIQEAAQGIVDGIDVYFK